jgi:hypothetical protein
MDPQVIVDRLVRLVRLDTTVFEEARDDLAGTIPALVIAVISFFLCGLGGWIWWLTQGYGDKAKVFWQSALLGSLIAFGFWVVWVLVAYGVLVYVFRYTANVERMIRACSLATIPVALSLIMFIPGVNLGIGLASFALMFLLMDIGIQVSVEAQPGHVIAATFLGFAVFCVLLSLFVQSGDAFAPGIFLFRAPASALSDVTRALSGFR